MTTAVSTSAAATSRTSYDNVGNVIGVKDALGRISKSTYDNLNRQISTTQAFGTVDATTTTYQYDKAGNLRYETNGRGYTTEHQYDAINRQTQLIDTYTNLTQTKYFDTPALVSTVLAELVGFISPLVSAITGKVIKTIDAKGNATYTLYDKFERQIETYDATKHRTSASQYDAVDRVIKSTDTFGQNTSYTYLDALNQRVTVDPLNGITTELFDLAGNLSDEIDALNRTTHYDYDKRNRQTRITDAEGGKTEYTYFNNGQTKSVKDAVNNITGYIYDIAGRLIEEDSVLGSRFYGYDLVNNRIKGTDRNGRVTEYGYDNLNRVKSELWVDNGKTFTYTYDKNGNRLTADDGSIHYDYSYDDTDLLERVDRIQTGNSTVSFKYDYDEIGNLTKAEELIANVLKATTIYKYNDPRYLNTEIIQTGVGLRNKDVKFAYNAAGLNTKVERYLDGLLKLTTTNAFDVYGRLTGIEQKNSAGVIASDVYDLDVLSRLRSETKDGQSRAIGYDDTDQVKSVSGSNSEAYSYDKNGNRIDAGYVTVAGNRLVSDGVYSYDYDAEGNRTKRTKISDGVVDSYTWDDRNRLVSIVSKDAGGSVLKTVGYEYDVDDQRVRKTVDGVVENYLIDRDQIAFVTDGGGMQMFHYLYGLNVDSVLAQDSPSGMVWSLADRLGSVDTLTDGDGVVVDKRTFDSFGRILSETNPGVSFRYGYTGRERDLESGLDYYRARYYDPANGRFISVDPAGFGAGDTNLYRYVGNNSTNATDPSGELVFALAPLIPAGISGTGWLIAGAMAAIGAIGTSITISNNAGAIGDAIQSGADGLGHTFNNSVANVSTFGQTLNDSVNAGTKAFGKAVNFWGSSFSNFSSFDLTNIGNKGLLEHFPTNPGEIPHGTPGFDLTNFGGNGLLEHFPTNYGEIPLGIPGFDLTNFGGNGLLEHFPTNYGMGNYVFQSNTDGINDSDSNYPPIPSYEDLLAAARVPYKKDGILDAGGRNLQKHGYREGSAFPKPRGNDEAMNEQARVIIEGILSDTQNTVSNRNTARFGDVVEIRDSSGKGVRFSADGSKFIGYLEPQK
jgi:RHS repeat-associated protein